MQSQSCELWFTEKSYMLHLALLNSQVKTAPEAWQLHCVFHFAAWLEKQICTLKTKNLGVVMCVSFFLHLHQCFHWLINAKKLFYALNGKVVLVATKHFIGAVDICFSLARPDLCSIRTYQNNLEACRNLFIYVSVLVFWFFLWKSTWEVGGLW